MSTTAIIIIVLAVVILWLFFTYNAFVRLKTRAKEALADIDVQLKRRYDLIPNLINTVKGYASHEREVLEKVTEARSNALNGQAAGPIENSANENMLSGALKSLFAVSENYPDLKASQNFSELQAELSDTENKIQAARRFYNTNVTSLNIKVESAPSNIVAKIFSFGKEEFFELEENSIERENIEVKF